MNPDIQNIINNFKASNSNFASTTPTSGGTGTDWYSGVKAGAYTPAGMTTPTSATNDPNAPSLFRGSGVGTKVLNAVTGNEQTFGKALSTIGSSVPGQADKINASNSASQELLIKAIHSETDPAKKQHMMDAYQKIWGSVAPTTAGDINPAFNLTKGQVIGAAGGTALDILSAGAYGKAAEGARTGELLTRGAQSVPATTEVVKQTLGQTLKDIASKTAVRAGVGGSTGYGYDVSQNLQSGKTGMSAFAPGMGTALGTAIPIGIGGIQATAAITKDIAPKFINSLIKPKLADFSYGKDPGRTVSAMGITGNNLNDFADNIGKAKDNVGSQIGAIYADPVNADAVVNANDTVGKLDTAIADATKGGKNNQGIVTTLNNIKDSLLYDHTVDAEGNIVKTSNVPRDLSNLTPQEAFDLKKDISSGTQFTGRASDDKTVNSVLKSMYGDLKVKLNNAVSGNNPEITKLNQQYADLTSAELATRNRDAIVGRANMISLPQTITGVGTATAALLSGAGSVPAVLAGLGAAGLEKALSSTAVKTRIAAWLGSESPSVITKVLEQNPGIKTVLYRALPKFASQLGQ